MGVGPHLQSMLMVTYIWAKPQIRKYLEALAVNIQA